MAPVSQKPPVWAGSSSSDTNTHTNTNSELDVLTSELLREILSILSPTRPLSGAPQGQNSPKNLLSPGETTSSSHSTSVLAERQGPSTINTPRVITRGSTPQNQHSASSIGLLATDSGLSESMIASLPFYDLSNYSRLLNTLNLLQSNGSGHAADATPPRPTLPHETSAAKLSEHLNQVPHRFSQFIMDQNAPWVGSDSSGSPQIIPVISETHRHSRDISWLMGSQATIFSTRPGEELQRRTSTRNSTEFSPLARRKAIRFKQGGRLYRLRLLLRKLAAKLRRKFGAVRRFVVRPKKATSKVKTPLEKPFLNRLRSARLKLGVSRMASMRAAQISAPLANPELEKTHGALKVDELTEELKTRAGVGGTPALRQGKGEEGAFGPWTQHPVPHAGSEVLDISAVPPPPPPHKVDLFQRSFSRRHEKTMFEGAWKQYLSNVLALRMKLRQEVHLFQLLLANQPIPSIFTPEPPKPRRWLESIGGDIKSHRASIVPGKPNTTDSTQDSYILGRSDSSSPTAPSDTPSHFPMHIPKLASLLDHPDSASLISTETDDESSDERIEKLQQVLNRRSMLGDMLDYDSDELASESSSMFSRDFFAGSIQESERSPSIKPHTISDPQLIKRYGMLNRRNNEKTSSPQGGSSTYPDSSSLEVKLMPRSPGINNLQAVATSAGEED